MKANSIQCLFCNLTFAVEVIELIVANNNDKGSRIFPSVFEMQDLIETGGRMS